MDSSPSQNLFINSHEAESILSELRIVRSDLLTVLQIVRNDKRQQKIFGEWWPEKDVIAITGLSRNTLRNMVVQGRITRSSISGKSNYYRASDFKALLDENEKK